MAVLLRTQSDERLVALARAGHERAFEVIVQRYRGLLLRSARRYLSDGRAEDAVQQAFLAAWSALQRGDEVRDLRPWLYRIVHNTALNALRAAGYDYAELPEGLAMSVDEVERREDARDALSGLAALPERQREALLRVAVEGRPQGEVARELGVSEGAVRQLVHRARLTLRGAATAVVPLPLASWAAGATGASAPTADRVAELVAGAGASALVAKAGTVAVIATTAVATPVIVHNDKEPRTPIAAATATPPRTAATPSVAAPATSPGGSARDDDPPGGNSRADSRRGPSGAGEARRSKTRDGRRGTSGSSERRGNADDGTSRSDSGDGNAGDGTSRGGSGDGTSRGDSGDGSSGRGRTPGGDSEPGDGERDATPSPSPRPTMAPPSATATPRPAPTAAATASPPAATYAPTSAATPTSTPYEHDNSGPGSGSSGSGSDNSGPGSGSSGSGSGSSGHGGGN